MKTIIYNHTHYYLMTKHNEQTRTTLGWNAGDVWAFQQLLKKANAQQLEMAVTEVEREAANREGNYAPTPAPLRFQDITEISIVEDMKASKSVKQYFDGVHNPNLTAQIINTCSSCAEEIFDCSWPYCPGCGKRLVNNEEQ